MAVIADHVVLVGAVDRQEIDRILAPARSIEGVSAVVSFIQITGP